MTIDDLYARLAEAHGWLHDRQDLLSGVLAPAGTWLKEWQDFASGLMALFGAWLIWRQTNHIERTRTARRHTALRAVLPPVLDHLMSYLRGTGALLAANYDQVGPGQPSQPLFAPTAVPRLHPDVLPAIADFVEVTDDQRLVRHLAKIVENIQVLGARVEGLTTGRGRQGTQRANMNVYLVECAALHVAVEVLFDYARWMTPKFDPKPQDGAMYAALHFMQVGEATHRDVYLLAAERRITEAIERQ